MAVKVGDNYKGILYSFSGSNGYVKYNNSSNNYQGSSTDYREPDVVSYDSQDSYKSYNITKDGLQAQYNSMIWGSQYDAMMNWMAKTGKEVGTADSTKTNTDSNKITGSSPDDIINNVYDLYGCHYEWTLEADNAYIRADRGGDYYGSDSPASHGYNNPVSTASNLSSRATLYIKCD